MNHEEINDGLLKGGELRWSGNCGFLKRADGEFIPWVSDALFKKEGFKKELAETFQFQLAAAEVLQGDKFSDAIWLGTTILLESGAYIPTPNKWVPNVGGYFLVKDPSVSNATLIAFHAAKGQMRWWRWHIFSKLFGGQQSPLKQGFDATPIAGEIHHAAGQGDLKKVKTLLKRRPELVFSKDYGYSMTPLHLAAFAGRKDVAELLLANYAEVNATDNEGQTPLMLAISQGRKDMAELLLAHKAEVNTKDRNGQTPLHAAASRGADVAELLLASRAEVNAADRYSQTPLGLAAYYGCKDVVELLLANRAEVNAKDDMGTPLYRAVQKGHKDVAELLRQHGGHE